MTDETTETDGIDGSDTEAAFSSKRLAALSDGIFAIAMTVMALELTSVVTSDGTVRSMWPELWPRLVAFVMSFLILSLFWIGHQSILKDGKSGPGTRLPRAALLQNLVFLGCIAIIPFPAALIGTHHEDVLSFVVYGGVLTLAAISLELSWYQQRHLLPKIVGRNIKRRLSAAIASYGVSTALAFIDPVIGLAAFGISHLTFAARPMRRA